MSEDLDKTNDNLSAVMRDRATPGGPAVLVQLAGPGAVRRFILDRPVTRIGREAETNEIVLSDGWVSRQHTQLVLEDGRARLEDRGSRNGCLLNSQPVENSDLSDGDLIQIGQAIFKYLDSDSEEGPFYQEVFRLAFRDQLTSTFSRRYFDEAMDRELKRAKRHREPLSVLLIDVDGFKQVNDTLGHKVGDEVLAATAETIQGALRRESITARFGGDEFVVLLPASDLDEATQVAEKLRRNVEALPKISADGSQGITISVGVATSSPGETIEADALLKSADEALYRAKRAGRNRVEATDSSADASP